jgi:hypothetical protein
MLHRRSIANVPNPTQGGGLDLPNSFSGHAHLVPDIPQRFGDAIPETIPVPDDALFAF